MPSLDTYKKILGTKTNGERRKSQSDDIILNSWDEDIQSKTAYIYDYYHDDEPLLLNGMKSNESKTKTRIDVKFIVSAYNSENKDEVGLHIQFKPRYNWENEEQLNYYKDYVDYYSSEFPMGLYIDIFDDEIKKYRKWLITEDANKFGNQFPTWYILPCDHVFQWISNGKMYQMCGVSRSQNSYNSGLWTDFKTTQVENQRKCLLPMNKISATIFYNTRIIISAPINEPISWQCSKVEQTSPKGVSRITFAQTTWNNHADAFQYDDGSFSSLYDESKRVVGMWADYYLSNIEPVSEEPIIETNIRGEITYSGAAQIKIGGSYKKFTLKFYDGDFEINIPSGSWNYTIDDKDASSLILSEYEDSVLKVKFIGNDNYLGKVLIIKYITDTNIEVEVKVEIKGL